MGVPPAVIAQTIWFGRLSPLAAEITTVSPSETSLGWTVTEAPSDAALDALQKTSTFAAGGSSLKSVQVALDCALVAGLF